MVRRTLGQVKPLLAPIAGQTGMPVTDELLTQYVNAAVQELMNEGDWPGVVDRWYFAFNETTALVSLPYFLERLIDVTVDDVPLEVRSPWYEFVQYGPGVQRDRDTIRAERRSWVSVVMDRGEVCTQHPLPVTGGPWTLCVETERQEDSTATMNFQGYDASGNVIRTQPLTDGTAGDWETGETISLTEGTSGPICTTQEFATLTSVRKSLTHGAVTLSATDGSTTLDLSQYQFDETSPSYRQYFIPHLYRPDTTNYAHRVILARCRRRFIPVSEDNDPLIIGNTLALQEMMLAQWYRTVPDLEEFAAHKAVAVDLMRKEAQAHMGKARTPSLTFSRGYPMGAMPFLR